MLQIREAATLDRFHKNHETLRFDAILCEIQVYQTLHRIEQHAVANKSDSLILHLNLYTSFLPQAANHSNRAV